MDPITRQQAEALLRAGKSSDAYRRLKTLLDQPAPHDLRAKAAQMIVTLGDTGRGLAVMAPLEESAPNETSLTRAFAEILRREWTSAELRLRALEKTDLGGATFFVQRALVRLALGQFEEAQQAIRFSKAFGVCARDLERLEVTALRRQGRLTEAWRRISAILERDPEDVQARLNSGDTARNTFGAAVLPSRPRPNSAGETPHV